MKDYKRLTTRDEYGNADILGVDGQSDNVAESRLRLVEMFVDKFP